MRMFLRRHDDLLSTDLLLQISHGPFNLLLEGFSLNCAIKVYLPPKTLAVTPS